MFTAEENLRAASKGRREGLNLGNHPAAGPRDPGNSLAAALGIAVKIAAPED